MVEKMADIAEKKLQELVQKVMASSESESDEEKRQAFADASAHYRGAGEMACALGILRPRDVDLIMQRESKEYLIDHKVIQFDVSVDGLRNALRRFSDSGQEGICGPWNIRVGCSSEKAWEAGYEGRCVFSCLSIFGTEAREPYGDLVRDALISDKVFQEICDLVHSEFPECRMSPKEQESIREFQQSFSR